ncbi:hypothetical protein ID875_26305 [Streptomyces globisporus]|uniref:Uncharacterized protein n=1 Tax=Streptomyces globisporus TaxID=1908 RepID=A0A927BM92_STRGL|nr:hypothetical protein [Streptomyces globisporus]
MTSDVESITVNGRETSTSQAAGFLASVKVGVQTVAVSNGPLERTFEFDFCLAEEEDLCLVDQALEKLISSRELSLNAIDTFIMRAGRGVTARRYREGVAAYLYGVLAREAVEDPGRVDASGATIYEQRFNSAVSLLSTFDRPQRRRSAGWSRCTTTSSNLRCARPTATVSRMSRRGSDPSSQAAHSSRQAWPTGRTEASIGP